MTPEEMQRAIEFLLDHDAKFAVKMERIENAQLKFTKTQGRKAARRQLSRPTCASFSFVAR
jgi:hypothetical protein